MGAGKMSDVEKPKLGNAIYKHPLRPQMVVMDPSDNLPRPAVTSSMTDTAAPPLDPDSLICMGDESVFVLKDDYGDTVCEFRPEIVRRTGNGFYRVDRKDLSEKQLALVAEKQKLGLNDWTYAFVEPLRPQCAHYRRVLTDFEGDAEHRQVERVCTAQRTESGEFTSLSDQRVFACEHRVPRDFVSEERLRRFDEKRIEEGKRTEEEWVPPTHGEQNG